MSVFQEALAPLLTLTPDHANNLVTFVSVDLRDEPQSGEREGGYLVKPSGRFGKKVAARVLDMNADPMGPRVRIELGGGADLQRHTLQYRDPLETPRSFAPILAEKAHKATKGREVIVQPLARGDFGFGVDMLHEDDLYWLYGVYTEEFGAVLKSGSSSELKIKERLPEKTPKVLYRLFDAQTDLESFKISLRAFSRLKRDGFIDQTKVDPQTGMDLKTGKPPVPTRLNVGVSLDVVYNNDNRLDENYYRKVALALVNVVHSTEGIDPDVVEELGLKDMIGTLTAEDLDEKKIFESLMAAAEKKARIQGGEPAKRVPVSSHTHALNYKDTVAAQVRMADHAIRNKQPVVLHVALAPDSGFAYIRDVVAGIKKIHPTFKLTPAQEAALDDIAQTTAEKRAHYAGNFIDKDFYTTWQIWHARMAQGGTGSFLKEVVDSNAAVYATQEARKKRGASAKPTTEELNRATRIVGDVAVHVSHLIAYDLGANKVTPAMFFADNMNRILFQNMLGACVTKDGGHFIDRILDAKLNLHKVLPDSVYHEMRSFYKVLGDPALKATMLPIAQYFTGRLPIRQAPALMSVLRGIVLDDVLPPNGGNRKAFFTISEQSSVDLDGLFSSINSELKEKSLLLDKKGAEVYLKEKLEPYQVPEADILAFCAEYIGVNEMPQNRKLPVLMKLLEQIKTLRARGDVHASVSDRSALVTALVRQRGNGVIDGPVINALRWPERAYPHLQGVLNDDEMSGSYKDVISLWRAAYKKHGNAVIEFKGLQQREPAVAQQIMRIYGDLPRAAREEFNPHYRKQIVSAITHVKNEMRRQHRRIPSMIEAARTKTGKNDISLADLLAGDKILAREVLRIYRSLPQKRRKLLGALLREEITKALDDPKLIAMLAKPKTRAVALIPADTNGTAANGNGHGNGHHASWLTEPKRAGLRIRNVAEVPAPAFGGGASSGGGNK